MIAQVNRLPTQRDRLRDLFRSRVNEWIPLPDIQALGIAMYPPRIKELRGEGMNIINKEERINGINHSWYKYQTVIIDNSGQAVMAACLKG